MSIFIIDHPWRKVVSATLTPNKKRWRVALECKHSTLRLKHGRTAPPTKLRCADCPPLENNHG